MYKKIEIDGVVVYSPVKGRTEDISKETIYE